MQIIREGDWQPAIRMAILILRNTVHGLASLTSGCAILLVAIIISIVGNVVHLAILILRNTVYLYGNAR